MSGFPSISRVRLCGESAHDCGYCKAKVTGIKDTSVSFGVVSEVLTVEDYQSMMLVGWRRSGTYFYKPTMHKTCCPQYTIRMRVNEHKASKSQKKTLKAVEKYLEKAADDETSTTTEDNMRLSSEFTVHVASVLPAEALPATPSSSSKSRHNTLTIEMDAATSTPEKFDLYKRYQIAVHKDTPDEVTEAGFKRFLVDSCLKDLGTSTRPAACVLPSTDGNANFRYGTHHMLYRLNGKLIAVGVVDLLPLGLSSVYVFYDNDYKALELGKYTALQEIAFCKQHGFPYYFMGFYIHTCEKMRYKGEYKPADLLCPTTLQWYPLHSHCVPLLEKFHFTPFEPALAVQRALCAVDVGNDPAPALAAAVETETSTAADQGAGNGASTASVGASGEKAAAGHAAGAVGSGDAGDGGPQSTATAKGTAPESPTREERLAALNPYAPAFFPASGPSLTQTLLKVPLDVGAGEPLYLTQLRKDSVKQLRPWLTEWLEHVGPEIGTTVALLFA